MKDANKERFERSAWERVHELWEEQAGLLIGLQEEIESHTDKYGEMEPWNIDHLMGEVDETSRILKKIQSEIDAKVEAVRSYDDDRCDAAYDLERDRELDSCYGVA